MSGSIFLRFWLNYIDETRGVVEQNLQSLIDKLEDPNAKLDVNELATAALRLGYKSTVGLWDALLKTTGDSLPTVSIPTTGATTGVVPMSITDYTAAKLTSSPLYALSAAGAAPIAAADVNPSITGGELTVTLVNGPWPTGTYLGSVLYDNNPIALVFTRRP